MRLPASRWLRVLLVLVALVLVVRIGAALALPSLLASWAESQDLQGRYERLDVSLLGGDLELWHLELAQPDGAVGLHVEYVRADVSVLDLLTGDLVVRRLELDGIDAHLERDAAGSFHFGALLDGGAGTTTSAGATPETPPEATTDTPPGPIDFSPPLTIDAMRAQHLDIRFVDRAVSPALELRLTGSLRVSDVGSEWRPSRVELDLSARPVLDNLRLAISAETGETGGTATVELHGTGLRPALLAAYLAPLGLEVEARQLDLALLGTLTARRSGVGDAGLRLLAHLDRVDVTADGTSALSVDTMDADLSRLGDDLIEVDHLALAGVTAGAGLDARGRLRVAGLVFGPADTPPPPEAPSAAPRLRVGHLEVTDTQLTWRDESTAPMADVLVDLTALTVDDFDTAPAAGAPAARVEARLGWPGVVEGIDLVARVHLFGEAPAGTLRCSADLVDTEGLAPWIADAPVRRELAGTQLGIDLEATGSTNADGRLDLQAALHHLALARDGVDVLALEDTHLDLSGLALPDAGYPTLDDGRLHLASPGLIGALDLSFDARQSAGTWLGRVDLKLARLTPEPARRWLPPGLTPRFESADLGLGAATTLSENAAGELLLTVALDGLDLKIDGETGAAVRGLDLAATLGDQVTTVSTLRLRGPEVRARRTAAGDLVVAGVQLGGAESTAKASTAASAAPAVSATSLRVDGARIEALRLHLDDHGVSPHVATVLGAEVELTSLVVDAEGTRAEAAVTASVDGALEALDVHLLASLDEQASHLSARLDARGLRSGPLAAYLPPGLELALDDGRVGLSLTARTTDVVDGGRQLTVELEQLTIADGDAAPVLHWPALVLHAARVDPDAGRFELDTFTLDSDRLRLALAPDGALELAGLRLGGTPAATPSAHAAAVAPDNGRVVRALPDVSLQTLQLDFDGLEVETPDGETFGGRLSLSAPSPLLLIGSDPSSSPPLALLLEGAAPSLVETLRIELTGEPLALEAQAQVTVLLDGLDGAAIERFAPDLDASEIRGGRLEATLSALIAGARSGPLDFDAARLTAELSGLSWRPSGDEIAVGLAGLRVEDLALVSRDGALDVQLIEVTEPRLRAHTDAIGLHVGGLVIARPEGLPAGTVAAAPVVDTHAGGGLNLARIYATGIDVAYRDTTTDPVTEFALVDLDVQVMDLDTRPASAGRPFYFEVLLGADRAFSELRIGGKLVPVPRLTGALTIHLDALDVTRFAGLAAGSGITLSDGRIDLDASIQLREDGSVDVESRTVLDNLSLTDTGGVLASALELQAPMDTVLFVLRDENGRIVVPLDLDVPAEGVGSGGVAAAALASFGQIVLTAIAQSPFRVIDTFGDLADLATLGMLDTVSDATGLGNVPVLNWFFGSDDPGRAGESFELVFDAAGSRLLDEDALDALAEALDDDDELGVVLRHEIGAADVARLEVLANPDPADARELSRRLLNRRDALLIDRQVQAAAVDTALAAALDDEAERQRRDLAALDAELGRLENSIDQVLALLRPGAEARAPRRTRHACEEIGALRLDLVRQALRERGLDDLAERLRVVTPRMPREVTREGSGAVLAELGRR